MGSYSEGIVPGVYGHENGTELNSKLKSHHQGDQVRRKDIPRIFLNCFKNHTQHVVQKGQCRCKKTYSRVPLEEIRNLLHLSLLGKQSQCKPRWCTLRRAQEISKVLVVVMHGVSSSCYRSHKDCFVKLTEISKVQTKVGFSSKQDLVAALFKTGSSETKKEPDGANDNYPGRSSFLVSKTRMASLNYPLRDDDNVVSTNHTDEVSDNSPLFALDCEMCQTQEGLELAKVCLVEEDGQLIYSRLVKPDNEIINYLTEYSGMTAETLQEVNTRLRDVQEEIIQLLPPDAILVGQSIENDLRALKMFHPFCVDTSDMFTRSGHRVGLANLTQFYLREIQSGDQGHDPAEDARAALDLFKLRLAEGTKLPNYKRRKGSQQPERISVNSSLLAGCQDQCKTCAIVDVRKVTRQFEANAADILECINDSESFKKATSAIKRRDFTWLQFHSLHNLLQGNWISEETLQMTLRKLDERLHQLYQCLPGKSLLITLMAPSDTSSKQLGRCFVTLTKESL
ncbi:putative small RNA degrading nuclease 5 isoform X1 [Apostichopus japonicus]|uniref:Putative small RNA degrading nuclease 5 isoform X1 n=1 Tax=Stichopus japonicus TaxID=307972 RepID=A0A2G8L305_STIJA|nr:putative small RNA degrading nuclease 5 isoform X1 [Apostichopus japonicus]